jgi:mannosyltransferase
VIGSQPAGAVARRGQHPHPADAVRFPGGPAPQAVTASRPLLDWTILVPPAVTLVVMLWGITARPYWGDEADTVSAVSRSLPQLARLLGHVDAVHGLYYLLLWPVARVAGAGAFAMRLPSVVAMAGAALGISVIGRRLRSRRAGLCAGLVFAVLPIVTQQAHDARPYAMATAAAVLASYLLLRAAADPRPARSTGYGLSLVLLGYLELFGLLIVLAHAITLISYGSPRHGRRLARTHPHGEPGGLRRRRPARRWLVTVAAVAGAVAPVLVWGWLQRGQIGWIKRPGWSDVAYLVCWLAAGSAASAVAITWLAVLGARRGDSPALAQWRYPAAAPKPARARVLGVTLGGRPGSEALTWLTLPWLLLPPVTLVALSEIKAVYSLRYVAFCLPAVALLAGAGLAALGWMLRAAAVALIVALAAPAQLSLRVAGSGTGGGMQAAAQVLGSLERPGDAVIYPGRGIPPWYLAYPQAFRPLRDIGMSQSSAAAGDLYGSSVPVSVLLRRERGVRRIWAVENSPRWQDPAPYLAPGFRLLRTWRPDHGLAGLALYQRAPAPALPDSVGGLR